MSRIKHQTIGYIVVDSCEEWEQPLTLEFGSDKPKEGVLAWRAKSSDPAHVFELRAEARQALTRTDHWGAAFKVQVPKNDNCKIIPLRKRIIAA